MRSSIAADISRQVLLVLHSISGGSPPKETFLCTATYMLCLHVGACVLYLALVYFFVYGHPQGPRSFTSPIHCQFFFIVAFILRSTWLRLICSML